MLADLRLDAAADGLAAVRSQLLGQRVDRIPDSNPGISSCSSSSRPISATTLRAAAPSSTRWWSGQGDAHRRARGRRGSRPVLRRLRPNRTHSGRRHRLRRRGLPAGDRLCGRDRSLQGARRPLMAGREFSERDVAAGDSAIVGQTAAARLWPGRDPVGRMPSALARVQRAGAGRRRRRGHIAPDAQRTPGRLRLPSDRDRRLRRFADGDRANVSGCGVRSSARSGAHTRARSGAAARLDQDDGAAHGDAAVAGPNRGRLFHDLRRAGAGAGDGGAVRHDLSGGRSADVRVRHPRGSGLDAVAR